MDLVGSKFATGYLPGLGILYNKKENIDVQAQSLGHEIGHWKLKHKVTSDPWEEFKQEIDAWEYPLSRGAQFDEKFIRQRLMGYSNHIRQEYGTEEWLEAIGMVDEMLGRYF